MSPKIYDAAQNLLRHFISDPQTGDVYEDVINPAFSYNERRKIKYAIKKLHNELQKLNANVKPTTAKSIGSDSQRASND